MQGDIRVAAVDRALMGYAEVIARRLDLELVRSPVTDPRHFCEPTMLLLFGFDGLSLRVTGKKAPGPVTVDWNSGKNAHRRHQGGSELVVKAVGAARSTRPLSVVDATAGLGEDALVLACHGCRVTLLERSSIMAELLLNGMERAAGNTELAPILARMELVSGDAVDWLERNPDVVDIVYLDPMFPERRQSAGVRKEMRVCRDLVGDDDDAAELLARALDAATHRVVVKRPRKADPLPGPLPATSVAGRSSRFDIYTRRALP